MTTTSDSQRLPVVSATIVLHHSDLEQLRSAVMALGRAADNFQQMVSVYFVDQSQDEVYFRAVQGLLEILGPKTYLNTYCISRPVNNGYGAGHNSVLGLPLGEYHLVLNPDVEVDDDFFVRSCAKLSQHPDVVVLGPRGKSLTGEDEFLAKSYPSVLVLALRAFGPAWIRRRLSNLTDRYELRDLPTYGPLQDVPLLSGCCLYLRTEAFLSVRGFDEDFFLYFEDYDLCRRLAERGRVVVDPELTVIHHGGQASKKGWRHILWFTQGGIRFFSRWGWRWV